MKHPEVLLLPIMIFADYFLTVLGVILRDKKYSLHFKIKHYELNPVWQEPIAKKKWFNLGHIVLTIILSGSIICLAESESKPTSFTDIILGGILSFYSIILGRHFSNLLIFLHLIRKPDEVSGEVSMSHPFVLYLSLYQALMVMVPIGLIAVFSRSNFALGGAIGIILFLIINLGWIQEAKKRRKKGRQGPSCVTEESFQEKTR